MIIIIIIIVVVFIILPNYLHVSSYWQFNAEPEDDDGAHGTDIAGSGGSGGDDGDNDKEGYGPKSKHATDCAATLPTKKNDAYLEKAMLWRCGRWS